MCDQHLNAPHALSTSWTRCLLIYSPAGGLIWRSSGWDHSRSLCSPMIYSQVLPHKHSMEVHCKSNRDFMFIGCDSHEVIILAQMSLQCESDLSEAVRADVRVL